ncbi:MAG: redoxin domain-containing protein [Nanoarchaeota archaeon]|nr:redoxin domain-containing protein [Nanoarchaeota archaeon]
MRIGEELPAITLKAFHNEEIKTISLQDYREKKWLVLLFYPADFTFICPTELEEAAQLYPEFQKENAEILSISTDNVYTHKAWHDHSPSIKKITYPMIADPAATLCKTLGTLIEEEGQSQRATFIINPEGKIISMEMHDNSIGRSVKEILRKLRAAKYVAEHPGNVCPVNWEPGTKTLKPGLDLVGKI